MKKIFSFFLSVILISSIVLFCFAPFSCRATEEGIEILSGDSSAPEIVEFKTVSSSQISLLCSEPVTAENVSVQLKNGDEISAEISDGSVCENQFTVSTSYNEEGRGVSFSIAPETIIGVSYTVTGCISDENGNSLTFSLPFTGWNSNPALMVLNEVRSEGSKDKPEYIELYVLRGGNTAGIELEGGYDGSEKKYSFPTMEVPTGEYITVHCRLQSEGTCVDETGDDIALSDTVDTVPSSLIKNKATAAVVASQPAARDLWIQDTAARVQKSDVIVLQNGADGTVFDALLMADKSKSSWSTGQSLLAEKSCAAGIWTGGALPSNAADSSCVTATRSLCRQNLSFVISSFAEGGAEKIPSSSASDWAVVNTSCATPGYLNSSDLYTTVAE